jgi:hypothetical protein
MNPVGFTPGELRRDEEKLRRRVRRRSLVGGGAAWLVIVSATAWFFVFPNLLQRIGSVLTVVGVAYLLIQLRLRPARTMLDAGETESVQFYRAELERQRDFHRGGWLWSRAIAIIPGPVAFLVGFARAYPTLGTLIWLELAILPLALVVGMPLNLRLARQYQRRIDALDAWQKG